MRALLLLLGLSAGCYESTQVECGALVCPSTKVCSPTGDACVLPSQLEACAGNQDGAGCTFPGTTDGVCSNLVCIAAGCGNGISEPGEVCDDGNRISLDGCRSDCMSLEQCGDGVVDPARGEQCDCGDATRTSAICMGPNSELRGAECRLDCRPARCGDGTLDPAEDCDDHNVVPFDGCRSDCAGRFQQMQVPTARSLNGAWAFDRTTAYAVGASGTLLRFDGDAWSSITLPTTSSLFAVWGTSPTNVYVGGTDVLMHFDGATWSPIPVPASSFTIFDIWGSSASDVYAVGGKVDALVQSTLIYHFDGTAWATRPWCTTTSTYAADVAGTTSSNVFIGNPDEMCRFNGATWSQVSLPAYDLKGNQANGLYRSVYSEIFRWAGGNTWTPLSLPAGVTSFVVIGPDHLVAVGNGGLILELRNGQWSSLASPTATSLGGAAASAADNVFIIGIVGTILH